jgi:hypothetical protein
MISHTFYRVVEKTFANAIGAKYSVEPVTYCTNNDGTGIFDESCMHQITGTGQFCGGREQLRRRMDDPDTTDCRVLGTEIGAKRVANKLSKRNLVKVLPVKQFNVGATVDYMGYPYTVLSQTGHNVVIKLCDEDYQTTVKDFDLYD